MTEHKSYLGDGAYVDLEGHQVKLTTSNGIVDTNTVYLGEAEINAFLQWLARHTVVAFPERENE